LPEAGGYHDQLDRQMKEMVIATNIYDTIRKVKSARGRAIHNLSKAERDLLFPLVKERLV